MARSTYEHSVVSNSTPRQRFLSLSTPCDKAHAPTRYRPPRHSATRRTSSEHVEYPCHDCRSGTEFASRPRRTRRTHRSDPAWCTGHLLAPQHAPLRMIFSLHPSCSPHHPPPPLGGSVQHCLSTLLPTTTLRRMSGSWRWSPSPMPLPPPIQRYHAQLEYNHIDIGQGDGTRIRCKKHVLPVYISAYSSFRNSMHVPVST